MCDVNLALRLSLIEVPVHLEVNRDRDSSVFVFSLFYPDTAVEVCPSRKKLQCFKFSVITVASEIQGLPIKQLSFFNPQWERDSRFRDRHWPHDSHFFFALQPSNKGYWRFCHNPFYSFLRRLFVSEFFSLSASSFRSQS